MSRAWFTDSDAGCAEFADLRRLRGKVFFGTSRVLGGVRPLFMKNVREFIWPLIGLTAVLVSGWLLFRELRGLSLDAVWASLTAIPAHRYLLAGLSTFVAYAALAWYDRIALLHLGVRHISWLYVSLCSFTTYALAHNIGASVFSGALVRYRAYSAKGLSAPQIAVLVALCSLTFGLGTILLGGVVLTADPTLLERLEELLPVAFTTPTSARTIGFLLIGIVALYVIGSILHLRPIVIRKFKLEYPRPAVMVRQIIAAPLELLGAAGIIYFALPEAMEPSFTIVLAVFLASFSAALVSHAPGGLGVFELIFLTAMPDIPKADVLAALIIFRVFYLLIPFALSIAVVLLFERARLAQAWKSRGGVGQPPPAPLV
jgi:glycosyltransferase 2 family protein